MKFGRQLAEHISASSSYSAKVYVDYNALKLRIRQRCDLHRGQSILETASFKRSLRKAIVCTNMFFVKVEADLLRRGADYTTCPHLIAQALELKQYAMLNYVAILKLLKKHDKHCATQLYPVIERILVSQPFVQALLSSPLFYGRGQPDVAAEGADADCEPASMAMCAICLEPRTHLQQLSCSHEFCMVCLAKASAAELHACPVCRSPQSLHPVDISLGQLNLSLKYHPRLHQPAAPSTRRTASIQSKSPTKATKTLAPHRRAGPVSTEQAGAILCTVHERPSEADEEADAPRTLPPSVLAEEPALADNAHILRRAVALEPLRALLAAGKRMAHMAVAALPCFRVRDAVRLSFSVLTLSLAGWLCVSGAGSGSSADGLDGLTADECAFSAHASGVHGQMLGYDGKTSVSVFSPGL